MRSHTADQAFASLAVGISRAGRNGFDHAPPESLQKRTPTFRRVRMLRLDRLGDLVHEHELVRGVGAAFVLAELLARYAVADLIAGVVVLRDADDLRMRCLRQK